MDDLPRELRERLAELGRHRGWEALQVTAGFPHVPEEIQRAWWGSRILVWPRGIPPGLPWGVLSSRLGRQLTGQASWFRALRELMRKIDAATHCVVWSPTTSAGPFVSRAAAGHQLPSLAIQLPGGSRQTWRTWLRSVEQSANCEVSLARYDVFVSPPLHAELGDDSLADLPLADRAVILAASELAVLQVRRGGAVERLVEARLQAQPRWPGSLWLNPDPRRVPAAIASRWRSAGMRDLPFPREPATRAETLPMPCLGHERLQPAEVPVLRRRECTGLRAESLWADENRYLIHCTRTPQGAWPDESLDQYLDSLVFGPTSAPRTALGALRRVLSGERLCASAQGIRGGWKVVSLTAVPLARLAELRRFRRHRGRWDFEPFGIGIERNWLEERGARPVIYGGDSRWSTLPPADRPFFQLQTTRARNAAPVLDWRSEQEWRVLGDLELGALPCDRGFVLVPSFAAAVRLAGCRWPLVVLPEWVAAQPGTASRGSR